MHAEDVGKRFINKEESADAKKGQKKEAKKTMFTDQYLYIGLYSFSGCSLSLQFVQSDLNQKTLAQRRLEALKLKRSQVQEDIEQFFSTTEPYYVDMLKMAKENDKKQQQFRRLMNKNPDKFVYNQVDKTEQVINRNMMLERTKIRK